MLLLPKKRVTEEDIKSTEARIAGSFNGLKKALADIPSEAARPVTDTIRAHPYASMAAATGVGFLTYRALAMLMPRTKIVTREVTVQPRVEVKEKPARRRSIVSRILSEAVALATPYITAYVRREVGQYLSKPGKGQALESQPGALEPDKS